MAPRRITDAQLADAVREHGTYAAAARALGISAARVRQRVVKMEGRLPGERITSAIRAAAGDMRRAAAELGVHVQVVSSRVAAAESLWPAGIVWFGSYRGLHVPPVVLAEALRRVCGSIPEAAARLGVEEDTLRLRLKRQPALMPPTSEWLVEVEASPK
jgi:hypothetical protein